MAQKMENGNDTQSPEKNDAENAEKIETTPRKRGRPAGAKNIPKPDAIPKPRKRPDDIADTRGAAQRRMEETRAILQRHDKENGTNTAAALPQWDDISTGKEPVLPTPQMDPAVISAYLGFGFGLLGETLDVSSRPAPESLDAAGKSIAELSQHLPPISPVALAAMTSAGALAMCSMPMILEYREIKAGKQLPASQRGEKNEKNI
jgi:hypothetical protein